MELDEIFSELRESQLRAKIETISRDTSHNHTLRLWGDTQMAELSPNIELVDHRSDPDEGNDCAYYLFHTRLGLEESFELLDFFSNPLGILRSWGYLPTRRAATEGDIALYAFLSPDKKGYDPRHVGIVENGRIVSKWNNRSVFSTSPELVLPRYGSHIGYFMKDSSSLKDSP